MRAKRGKRRAAPAIVPRFLKGAVTIGVIPALVGACDKPRRVQPVVAYFAPPSPQDADVPHPQPPVVAAYQREIQPVVAAYAVDAAVVAPPLDAAAPPIDAAVPVDAPAKKVKKGHVVAPPPPPPPPVVAAMIPNPGPAVVAAYVPRPLPIGSGSGSAAKKPKKP